MAGSYTVKQGDSLQSIAQQHGVSLQEMKQQNPELASRTPPYDVRAGDTVTVPPAQQTGDLRGLCETCKCIIHDLAAPFLIAIARDGAIVKQVTIQTEDGPLDLGQDATFAAGRTMPNNQMEVGSDETTLKAGMNDLLAVFSRGDSDGKARRIFEAFQRKNSAVQIYSDPKLDQAIADNPNFKAFSNRTLSPPGTTMTDPRKTRIHQALKRAHWDINAVTLIDDLGIPAFNSGTKTSVPIFNSEDWANGLAVMINGVQYVFVYVTKYHYDSCKNHYEIELRFVLYDVFGLDDTDVVRYGAASSFLGATLMAQTGITAWWQLQHQHSYAPLLTRAVVTRSWTVLTLGD